MKKPPPRTPPLMDLALDCCHNIETIAGLLSAGTCAGEGLESELVENAGWLICRETERLRAVLQALPPSAKRQPG